MLPGGLQNVHFITPYGKTIDLLMDPGLDAPLAVDTQAAEVPSPWIATGLAHLLFWVVLVWPVVAGRFGQGGFDRSTLWVRPVAAWLASLLLTLAALRSMRRSGAKEGRDMAIAALVLCCVLLLPLLLVIGLLILWSARIIR